MEVLVCQDADVFRALQVAILMPVVNDCMSSGSHHLTKLNYLLRVSAGIKLFTRNRVRQSENVVCVIHFHYLLHCLCEVIDWFPCSLAS